MGEAGQRVDFVTKHPEMAKLSDEFRKVLRGKR